MADHKADTKSPMIVFLIVAFLVGGAGGFAGGYFIPKKTSPKSGMISLYPSTAEEVGKDWIAKIDNYAISQSEFEEGYDYFLKQMQQLYQQQGMPFPADADFKNQYFDSLISQYILVIQALKEDIFADETNELLLTMSIREAIYKVYLNKYLPEDETVFMPSKVELNQAFAQYGAQLQKMGMNAQQIKDYLTQRIAQQKMQLWIQNMVARTKENFKIERNKELLKAVGIDEVPVGTLLMPGTSGMPQP